MFRTHFLIRKLRSNVHGQILINMSVSLLALYVTFLLGGFVTEVPGFCGLVSALLQYFFLVFFAWTAVESVWLYFKLVAVLGADTFSSRYMLKAGLPAWCKGARFILKLCMNSRYFYGSCKGVELQLSYSYFCIQWFQY